MPARIIIRSGYDFAREFTVRVDGVAEVLTGATIEASLKNEDKSAELIADVAQSDGAPANWAAGKVVVRFTAVTTAGLTPQRGWIELGIVKDGLRLPVEDIAVVIEKGWTP